MNSTNIMPANEDQYVDHFANVYEALPKGKAFRLTYDPVTRQLKVIAKSYSILEELRNAFSADNPTEFIAKQYGYNAEKKVYQINKFGYFAPGLVFEVMKWIQIHYGDLSFLAISQKCKNYIIDNLMPLKKLLNGKVISVDDLENVSDATGRNENAKLNGKDAYVIRDYQAKSIVSLIQQGFGRGMIEIPTSGGKSFIIANFIWNVNKFIDPKMKVLIFVPNTQLVEQFYKDLVDYGYLRSQLARFTGSLKAKEKKQQDLQNAKIIIANRQYLYKNWRDLPVTDILVCDEVHTANAKVSKEFIDSYPAKIKVGCSGTLPKDKLSLWDLQGMFGKVLYKISVKELQDRGYVSKLKITLLDIMHRGVENNRHCLFNVDSLHKYHPDEFGNSDVLFNEAYNAETEFYQKESRTLYSPVFSYLNTLDENILVLFDRIETGKSLFELAKELVPSKKAFYIDGATEVRVREEVRQEFEKSGDNILVGNVSILGTGVNIRRLKHIVFIASSKSFSRVIQSIGRILRLHSTKDEAHLIDVVINTKYSQRHYAERLKYYKDVYHKKRPDETIKMTI